MKPLLVVVALLIPIGTTFADDEPQPKDGLWSIHTQIVEHPTEKRFETNTSYCKSHAQEERTASKPAPCRTVSDSVSNGTRTKKTECPADGRTVKSTATFTGDSTAHVETQTVYNRSSSDRKEVTMITDEKYVGACPAGVEPGDMLDANGRLIHHGK